LFVLFRPVKNRQKSFKSFNAFQLIAERSQNDSRLLLMLLLLACLKTCPQLRLYDVGDYNRDGDYSRKCGQGLMHPVRGIADCNVDRMSVIHTPHIEHHQSSDSSIWFSGWEPDRQTDRQL